MPIRPLGKLLITTRDSHLGLRLTEGKLQPIQVDRLDYQDARQLLRAKISDGSSLVDEDADKLTDALAHLPLTITQAAAYLNQSEMSASEYLAQFRKAPSHIVVEELLEEETHDPTRDSETSNSIFKTWMLSFEQISTQNPRAAEILCLMAMLDRQGVSQDLLKNNGESLLRFKAAVSKLKAFSFIEEENRLAKYSMHRLVQASTQRWIRHLEKSSDFQERAVTVVASCCPPTGSFEHWPVFIDLGSHFNVVLDYKLGSKASMIHRASILHAVGHYTMESGQDRAAQEKLSAALALRQEHLEPDHLDTLTTMGLLGVTYSKLQHWREAQNIQSEVRKRAEQALGPCHRLTLKSKSRFAITHNKQSNNEKCRVLQVEVLNEMEKELG